MSVRRRRGRHRVEAPVEAQSVRSVRALAENQKPGQSGGGAAAMGRGQPPQCRRLLNCCALTPIIGFLLRGASIIAKGAGTERLLVAATTAVLDDWRSAVIAFSCGFGFVTRWRVVPCKQDDSSPPRMTPYPPSSWGLPSS
jgi:hypothetical protein